MGRALAEARGSKMTQRELAEAVGRGAGTVARWETGDRMPEPADVKTVLTTLGITGDRYAEILAMATGGNGTRWLAITLPEQQAQLSALVDTENNARRIVAVNPLLVPGLLQTSDCIREIMVAGKVPPDQVGTRVAARIGRRDVITRRDPAHLLALVGEAALRQIIGSRKLMKDQLKYLLEMAKYSNVEIRVVPFSSGWNPMLQGAFVHIEPADGGKPIVHLEAHRSGLMLDAEEDVAAYQDAIDTILEVAMSPADTSRLIARVITDLEQT